MDFANACRELPSDYRQYLVFELADVPDGVPQSRLADLATALRPYAKAIRAYIPSGCRALSVYQGIGLQAICLDLSRLRLKSKELGGDEISRISNAARRMSLPMVIGGISDVAALKMAHESGAHFLTGRAVSLPLADPAPMKRFPWRELVQASMLNQRVA